MVKQNGKGRSLHGFIGSSCFARLELLLSGGRFTLDRFDNQLASKSEVGTLAAFHVLRCRLRKSSDENRKGDGGVANRSTRVRPQRQLAIDAPYITRNVVGSATWVTCI